MTLTIKIYKRKPRGKHFIMKGPGGFFIKDNNEYFNCVRIYPLHEDKNKVRYVKVVNE